MQTSVGLIYYSELCGIVFCLCTLIYRDYQSELEVSMVSGNAVYHQRRTSIYNELDETQVYNDIDETQVYYNDLNDAISPSSASAVQDAAPCAQQPKHDKLKLVQIIPIGLRYVVFINVRILHMNHYKLGL